MSRLARVDASIIRVVRAGAAVFLLFVVIFTLSACQPESMNLESSLASEPVVPDSFERAEGPMPLIFPEDHGPHPDYQTEWWYYTGNLDTTEGRHFGYQLTFFRRALIPAEQRSQRNSDWATDQVFMGHFALTNVQGNEFNAFERFSRGAAGLSGAQADPYAVWLEDWQVKETNPGTYNLVASQEGIELDLTLTDRKGPILQGDQGYSQKGPDPGNASYYYSLTRLESNGIVRLDGESFAVSGTSWMDHEYSTSALSAGQIGWDWFSLQLSDNSELMVFQIRRDDGSIDPFSGGSFVASDGSVVHLAQNDFIIEIQDTWASPRSSGIYPSRWAVSVPKLDLILNIEPFLADQELDVSYAYWEGAVRFDGNRATQLVNGHGYVEMTGYASSMQGQF